MQMTSDCTGRTDISSSLLSLESSSLCADILEISSICISSHFSAVVIPSSSKPDSASPQSACYTQPQNFTLQWNTMIEAEWWGLLVLLELMNYLAD